MKFLQAEGSLINAAHIERLSCLPRYACKSGQIILSNWVVEVIFSDGGGVDLGSFDSKHDAEVYLADLAFKLDIEIVKG